MLYYLVSTIFVLDCFVLILVILLQQGKGGDIAAAFGGGSSQAAFGARSGATVLSRATSVCFIIFIVGALSLSIMSTRGPGSVVGGTRPAPVAPVQPSSPAAPSAPTTKPGTQPATPGGQNTTPAPAAPAPAPPVEGSQQ